MQKTKKARNISMDLVRCFAFFFVVCTHFMSNIGYYDQPMMGKRMFIMTVMRCFFSICVPLFMMLSGYFMGRKKVEKSHYSKITKTLVIYLLSSLACVLYKILYLKQPYPIIEFVRGFFSFGHANYSWYIEMYIGLFLLCPFLNLTYHNLDSKKKKQLLIFTMIFLTALPNLVNTFVPDLNWFAHPTSSSRYFPVIPAYWTSLFPITYYFLGCYLREFPVKMKKRYLLLLNIVTAIINGSFIFYRCYGSPYIWGSWQSNGSILILTQAVLFLSLFENMDCSNVPSAISKLVCKISELTLGAYLVSYIFDNYFYKFLNSAVQEAIYRHNWFPVMVVLVIVCSLMLSGLINFIYKAGSKLYSLLKSIIKNT